MKTKSFDRLRLVAKYGKSELEILSVRFPFLWILDEKEELKLELLHNVQVVLDTPLRKDLIKET